VINPLQFAGLVDPSLQGRSGSVFYSGRAAFSKSAPPLYVLGLNPGGSPEDQSDETIGRDLEEWLRLPERWSAYKDESWRNATPGTWGMQPRILHMFDKLGLDPHEVPASNAVFVRSSIERNLAREKSDLSLRCWPVDQAVIRELGASTVLWLGRTAGKWARDYLQADRLEARFSERNARKWTSAAHFSPAGVCVVTATHPSRADWRNPASDPTPLVKEMLER